jgi:hypothetical protein
MFLNTKVNKCMKSRLVRLASCPSYHRLIYNKKKVRAASNLIYSIAIFFFFFFGHFKILQCCEEQQYAGSGFNFVFFCSLELRMKDFQRAVFEKKKKKN